MSPPWELRQKVYRGCKWVVRLRCTLGNACDYEPPHAISADMHYVRICRVVKSVGRTIERRSGVVALVARSYLVGFKMPPLPELRML